MEAKKFQPSKYQQSVYDFISNGNGNAVIDAVAGSGKSTTIVNALNLIPSDKHCLFLAFNVPIVEELKKKVGNKDNVDIRTLHSLGARAVYDSFKTTLDNNKYKTELNIRIDAGSIKPNNELEPEEFGEYKNNIFKFVNLIRVYLCNSVSELEEKANKHSINIIDNECEKAFELVHWGLANTKTIDYTDQIYYPNVKKLRIPTFDFVFIDECQDLNTAQRELFLKTLAPNGRFIAVGDPRQAIYGFAGADVMSFEMLKNTPNTTLLPLSVCYRCDEDIINYAKTIVPQIEARDNAPKGLVNEDARLKEISDSDMVLCRITAPLVKLCMKYLSEGVKAYVKGKDVGANLINMIKNTNRKRIDDVIERLNNELRKIAEKIQRKTRCSLEEAKESDVYVTYKDKLNAIIVLSQGLTTADAVMNRIKTIFESDENKSGICLSTIHKAKGLEANRVFIICRDKLLLKHCMRVEWMREQEYNLVYVAYTRAKNYLGFVTDFHVDRDADLD